MYRTLLGKTFVLILLSILLFSTYIYTKSLAVLSDALYAVIDAAYVFSLWAILNSIHLFPENKLVRRITLFSIGVVSLLFVLGASLLLYVSFLSLQVPHEVQNPYFVIGAEMLYIFILGYVYSALREQAVRDDIRALGVISKDVENNIIASFGVIIAALFSLAGMYLFDVVVAAIISVYLLYKSLVFSFRSFRSLLGVSDPLLFDVLEYRVRSLGVKIKKMEVTGMGPYYLVEMIIDVKHLPDTFEKVEALVRRRVEELLPSTARVIIKEG